MPIRLKRPTMKTPPGIKVIGGSELPECWDCGEEIPEGAKHYPITYNDEPFVICQRCRDDIEKDLSNDYSDCE